MKNNKIVTAKELKQLAATFKEMAQEIEKNEDMQCLQSTRLKVERSIDEYGVMQLEVLMRFNVFETLNNGFQELFNEMGDN